MESHARQSWPLSAEVLYSTLPVERLVEIARFFRIPLPDDADWNAVHACLLSAPAPDAVRVLHLLTRRELGAVCRLADIADDGPTQRVLAQLLPLCVPAPSGRQPRA